MKTKCITILTLLAFVFPLTMLAASKNSQSVNIAEQVKVANTELQPGDYKVEWSGSGPDVQVSFVQGNKTVATVPAKLEAKSSPYANAVETKTDPDNSKVLQSIMFKKEALRFGAATSSGGE